LIPNRCCPQIAADAKSLLPPNRRCPKIAAAAKSLLPPNRGCPYFAEAAISPLFCRGCHIAAASNLELAEAAKSPNRWCSQIADAETF